MGRVGGDTYTTRRTSITPWGTAYSRLGGQSEIEYSITEINTDFLINMQQEITPDIGVQATFGGNILFRENETLTLSGGGFNVSGLEVVTNQNTRSHGYGFAPQVPRSSSRISARPDDAARDDIATLLVRVNAARCLYGYVPGVPD